ncbi:MAG TPA: HAD family hydrolase [Thermoplasmata archaeon]|nr:HAD family hydrolase [Thermoplasmata archaeon]
MTEGRPKSLFLDLPGVLLRDPWAELANSLAGPTDHDPERLRAAISAHTRPFEVGVTSIDAFCRSVSLAVGSAVPPTEIQALLLGPCLSEYPDNRRRVAEVRERLGIRVIAVANLPAEIAREADHRFGLGKILDGAVISHRFGIALPNPQIFIEALSVAGTPPSECVFIGGRVEDVRAANGWGIVGRHLPRPDGLAEVLSGLD